MRKPRMPAFVAVCLLAPIVVLSPTTTVSETAPPQLSERGDGDDRLILAARDGKTGQARALIAAGSDVNYVRSSDKMTALMMAANQGYTEIARLLLDAGADPRIAIWDGSTALVFAARNGRLETVELLLTRSRPGKALLQKALSVAARTGRPKTSVALVRAGADINAREKDGMTPLMLAAKFGFAQTARILVAHGATVGATDGRERTALMWAAWMGHEKVARALLGAGADPGATDANGTSAFGRRAEGEAIATLFQRHRARVKATPKQCRRIVGTGMLWAREGRTAIGGYGFYRRPGPSSTAWVVRHDTGMARRGVVTKVKRREGSDGGWDAEFEPLDAPVPARQRNATIFWPSDGPPPRMMTPKPGDLPWGVFAETVDSAIDVDADGKTDVLSLQYCCRDASTKDGCDYHCGENWSREDGRWLKCQSWNPA